MPADEPDLPPILGALPVPLERATFCAIDFETATHHDDSACAVGLVRVERGLIVAREHCLLRPPREEMRHTQIHGIAWADVCDAEPLAKAWRGLRTLTQGVDFFAAHQASFDRRVLHASGGPAVGAEVREIPFLCSLRLARRVYGLKRPGLASVAALLGIPLRHHEPLSDAEACARIVLAAGACDAAGSAVRAKPRGRGASSGAAVSSPEAPSA